ncbi:MAG: methyltransferase [Verrucomicrobia bacterium RIFCSPLOWO2_12_FULL_64_8]|nr:MAG: methyltransferase [Verrucomicrobia bacterium RIFCSPLOWO2_12_FULL_64_8]
MRISGGAARGVPLTVPKGAGVRPATDGMRQAVFSSLGERVVDAVFWDLFAGSGAYGLEALSRGAKGGVFVERDTGAVAVIKQNLAAVIRSLGGMADSAEVATADARTWTPRAGALVADLVFIDPPYELVNEAALALFARLDELLAGRQEALVLFEMPGAITLAPEGWVCLKRLGKGAHQPTVCVYRRG